MTKVNKDDVKVKGSVDGTVSTREDTNNLSEEQKKEADNFFGDVRKVSRVSYQFDDDGERRPRVFSFIPELDSKGNPVVYGSGDDSYCIVTFLSAPKNQFQSLGKTTQRTPFYVKESIRLQAEANAKIESVRNNLLAGGPVTS